jgi:hypothetical protein
MNTDKTTVQDITDDILPVIEDNIWDTIMADNDQNGRYGELRNGEEVFLFDFEIYKNIINTLHKQINREANLNN